MYTLYRGRRLAATAETRIDWPPAQRGGRRPVHALDATHSGPERTRRNANSTPARRRRFDVSTRALNGGTYAYAGGARARAQQTYTHGHGHAQTQTLAARTDGIRNTVSHHRPAFRVRSTAVFFFLFEHDGNRGRDTPGDAVPLPTNANNALLCLCSRHWSGGDDGVGGGGGGGGVGGGDVTQRAARRSGVLAYGVLAECGLRGGK